MVAPDAPPTPARLLIAYDGSDTAADAVRAAGRLFRGARAQVTYVRRPRIGAEDAALARIAMPDHVIAAAADEHEREARARDAKVVEHGRLLAERAGLQPTAEIREATAAWRGIDAAARDANADVIVCGSRGLGPFSRALLGSTSSSLLYHADRSVLLLPPGGGELDGPMLIGYEGSDGAREAVDAAARLLLAGRRSSSMRGRRRSNGRMRASRWRLCRCPRWPSSDSTSRR
jgi:nucleotide-binding universal stress UspA family protein